MSKKIFILAIISVIICSITTSATEIFSDITADAWYKSEVESVYSAGLMTGTGNGLFSPNGTVSIAEAVTVAARASASYNGDTIPATKNGDSWYTPYFEYGVQKGIIDDSLINDASRNALRHELAEYFAKGLPEEYYPAQNSYTAIPDIYYTDSYQDEVLLLYNAGVLTGNDSYGAFFPENSITRAELAAIVNRVAFPEKRISGEISPRDAYYIIDAPNMASGRNGIANGWLYDNKASLFNTSGRDAANVSDNADDNYGAMYRDFDSESDGILTLEVFCAIATSNDGVYIGFADSEENLKFCLTTKDRYVSLKGNTESVSDIRVGSYGADNLAIVMNIDLDKNTLSATVNNTDCGTVEIDDGISVSRLILGTTDIGMGSITANQIRLTKNYMLSEHFSSISSAQGQTPVTMETTGDVTIAYTSGCAGQDVFSAKIAEEGKAYKSFNKIPYKGAFESYILLPQKTDGAYFALYEGNDEIIRVETKNGAWYSGNTKLRDYTANIWQTVRIDTDLRSGNAVVKICGKAVATLPVSAQYIDGITVGFAPGISGRTMYFDDITAFNIVDHSDYPESPKVSPSTDYNIILNVCNLWRDAQSGEGWDSSTPFAELEPLLGFYEEGSVELADWEIKMMVEHGIDIQHICWYCPSGDIDVPIKSERVSHAALHDGFMQARYSDLMQFCLMWENGGKNVSSLEQFKTYLWNYWKEYYFSDPRHARIDNKAVLTVWSISNFKDSFGGNDGAREAIEFMREDIKSLGYDGIILMFADGHQMTKSFFDGILSIGADATYPYHFNREGRFAEHQIYRVSTQISFNSVHTLPAVSIGFNDIGRNENRTAIITPEEHRQVCEYLRDEALPARRNGDWRDNTLLVSTWNEYSEGTYAMPCVEYGYAFLDNIRDVFTDSRDVHSDDIDVIPTQNQKDRITRMYYEEHQPIRWYKYEESDIEKAGLDATTLTPKTSWNFSTYSAKNVWQKGHGLTTYEETATSLKGSAETSSDFAVITSANLGIPIDEIPYIHIRMKVEGTGSQFEIFFATNENKTMGSSMRIAQNIKNKGEFVDYYVDMTEISTWEGSLYQLRIDPMIGYGSFEIECVELMQYAELEDETFKWVFAKDAASSMWEAGEGLTHFEVADGCLKGSSAVRGSVISKGIIGTKLDNYPYIRLRVKTTGDCDSFNVLFTTEQSTAFDSNKRKTVRVKQKGDFADYYIRMDFNKNWSGPLHKLGIEFNGTTQFEIESIELMDNTTMPVPAYSWIFSESSALTQWSEGHGMKEYSEGNGVIKGSSESNDYAVIYSSKGINIDETKYLHIRMKTSGSGSIMEVFFKTADALNEADNRLFAELRNKGEFTDYYIDMSAHKNWKGDLTYLRIDPMSGPGSFEIESISLVGINNSLYSYSTNTRPVSLNFAPVLLVDGNYEITGDPRKGFYSSIQLFHVWDRYTGSLMIESKDKRIYLETGSSKMNVNGKTESLGYTFRLRDGLPVFRLNELMDLLGYKVHISGYSIDIQTVTDDGYTAIKSRLPNCWDFEFSADNEGFSGQNATITVMDGMLILSAVNTDPAYISPPITVRADKYSKLVIGIVGDTALYRGQVGQMFFTTTTSTSMSEDKSIKHHYDITKMTDGEIYEIVYNLSDCTKWGGNINKLRFDPFNRYGTAQVDYIYFLEE